jgi:outer membrane protein insertion porin family
MEGALYDGALIRRSKMRLQQTGFYDKIDTKTIPVPGHPDQLDLDVHVSERPTGSFSIGVGYSNAYGIMFNGSISQNNFMGTGNALAFSANVSGLGTAYNLSFTDPYFTPDGISLGFSLYRNNTNLSILSVAPYQEIDYGGTTTLGIPVMQYVYDYMSLGFSNTTINLFANPPLIYQNYVSTFGNTATALTVGNDLIYDSRNSPIFPTKGFYGSLSLKAAVPPATLRWYKAEIKADYYHPINSWLTAGLSGRYGVINGYGGKQVPFFNNYYMGGPTTLPGYQTYSLGPLVGGYPVGGTRELLFNASLYFPLPGLANNNNFRMSLFLASGWVYGVNADPSGNQYTYNNSYFPSLGQMRTTAGVGFLWISPMGPLRLSLAVPLNKQPGDLTQPLQFTVGNNF